MGRVLRVLAAAILGLLALVGLFVLRAGNAVRFSTGIELIEITAPNVTAPGRPLHAVVKFRVPGPLPSDHWVFAHLETEGAHPDPHCRVVIDGKPTVPSTKWQAGVVEQALDITVPAGCTSDALTLYVGLWDPVSGARMPVRDGASLDNRVAAAFLPIEPDEKSVPKTISGRRVVLGIWIELLRPFAVWLSLFAVAAFAALLVWARGPAAPSGEPRPPTLQLPPRTVAMLAVPVLLFLAGVFATMEFVKDDAYISYRYAHNLVHGHGLVFNPGDRLEGYTNFLWTMLMVPFEALGWELFQVSGWIGSILCIATMWLLVAIPRTFTGARKDFGELWAAAWIGGSSSFSLWAKGGLEQPLAIFLPLLGAWLLWTVTDAESNAGRRRLFWAGVALGLGCTTRPELHLIAAIIGAPVLVDLVRRKISLRAAIAFALGVLAITAPFHLFRWGYYHSLLPNTYYVKTSKGSLVWRAGLGSLHDLLDFNATGALLVLAPFAFVDRRWLKEKLVMAAISLAFFAFIVKVGVDEMQWHRLYLPALPFLLLLAAFGLQVVVDGIAAAIANKKTGPRWLWPALAAWAALVGAGARDFAFTYKEFGGFNGLADFCGQNHPDMGKFLTRHERTGGLIAFQDMGATPYHAPDLDFLDFIGLVDGHVARARHAHGLHAFTGTGNEHEQRIYDAEMREYFWSRRPEWTILTVYPPVDREQAIADAFAKDPTPKAIGDAYSNNSYQFGIWSDPRFAKEYVHVRTWMRSRGYYLSMYRRRDLWEQTPGEVVLDAAPANPPGPKAKFAGGLELLGAEFDQHSRERGEIYVTTWWRVPGPMPADTQFFVHINSAENKDYQAPYDHVPGDFMYPADRWKPGQIIEDRTLLQLPLNMRHGKYKLNFGVYRHDSGERLKILEGANDGADRVLLGDLQVDRLLPPFDAIIAGTVIEKHRKYPDRIVKGR